MELGERIRKLRREKGMTQAQLAAPLFTHVHVSTVESGRRRPSRRALEHFAEKLGVDVDELETGRSASTHADLWLQLEEIRVRISNGETDEASARLAELASGVLKDYPDLIALNTELQAMTAEKFGETERALELFEEAEAQRRAESPSTAGYAVAGQVRNLHTRGDVYNAILVGERFLTELRVDGVASPDARAMVLSPLVRAYFETGARTKAGELATELLSLAESVQDPNILGAMYVNVARVQYERGETRAAERSLLNAERIYTQLNRANEMGIAVLSHGLVLAHEDRDGAVDRLKEAISILRRAGNEVQVANGMLELGALHRRHGRIDEALRNLDAALEIVRTKDDGLTAWGLREKARCLIDQDAELALKSAGQALEIYERIDQPHERAVTHALMGRIHESAGAPQEACRSFRSAALLIAAGL